MPYDYANRLIGYINQTGSTTNANYTYSFLPTGARLSKVNTLPPLTNNEEWYANDGSDVTADYQRSTGQGYNLTATYVNGGAIDSKWVRILANGTELYYLGDALNSVHEVIDQFQTLQDLLLTTAWGENLPGFTNIVGQPDRYGFTQREKDSESSTIQFRARNYDPRTGRFLETDPVLVNRAFTHYAFASNNPVSHIDPTGLQDPEENVPVYSKDGRFLGMSADVKDQAALKAKRMPTPAPTEDNKTAVSAPETAGRMTDAQLQKVLKTLGYDLFVDSRGKKYLVEPGGPITDPKQAMVQINAHLDEITELTFGINFRHPTTLQISLLALNFFLHGAGKLASAAEEANLARTVFKSADIGKRAEALADAALIQKLEQRGYKIFQGADVDKYLSYMKANASTSGNMDILLRADPRRVEVIEEWLHNVQGSIGMGDKLSRTALEFHVKDFMIRHQKILGLAEQDIEWLKKSREMYKPLE